MPAQVAHQVLRRYETYTFSFYGLVLLVPPALIATLSTLGNDWPMAMLSSFLLCCVLYLMGITLAVVIYRLSPLHPLARYPGPRLCSVSGFMLAFKSMAGDQHLYMKSLHDRYGDVVRIGLSKWPLYELSDH